MTSQLVKVSVFAILAFAILSIVVSGTHQADAKKNNNNNNGGNTNNQKNKCTDDCGDLKTQNNQNQQGGNSGNSGNSFSD